MSCINALINGQSDGASKTYTPALLHGGRIHDSIIGEDCLYIAQRLQTRISLLARNLYDKVNMPPLTRSQTKPLPSSSTNGDTSPTTETLSSRHLLRHRKNAARPHINAKNTTTTASTDSTDSTMGNNSQLPPRFTIDLSLPPSERYAEVCHALGDEMRGLQSIFDEVVGGFLPSWLHVPSVVLNWIAWALLWRVCDAEEDAELDVSYSIFPHLYASPDLGSYDVNDVLCYDISSRVTTGSLDRATYERKTERTSR